MSILAELKKIEDSEIYKLKYDNRVVGLRVKHYSSDIKEYNYYDFEISYVKRQDLREFLNKYSKSFKTLKLVEYNGLVCTQDEISGAITVKEFKDEESASVILDAVVKIMRGVL